MREGDSSGTETAYAARGLRMKKRTSAWRQNATLFAVGLAALQPAAVAAHVFPYVPTQILLPTACAGESTCSGADLAYVFSQSDDGSVQFSAFNYSTDVAAGAQPAPVTTDLPFLKSQPATTAFGAARTSNGSVVVYSGACDGTAGSLWSFSSEATGDGGGGGGAWSKRTTTSGSSQQGSSRGPYFLGGTLAFSSKLSPTMDQPTVYTYGGMCHAPNTSSETWQSNANYTKAMMSLAPSTQAVDTAYSLSVASTAGPRTPIAGFTLTQLPASVTNISGAVSQQAGFVLLGGHTQEAFINMSTAAVWNLPEESWSYINIGGADAATGSDNVESRSGHTAVLTEDGTSIVVLGGWVGDVSNAAEPQLVVLQLAQTYSSWKWSVPREQPGGKGVYGHGAAMLPGNVMMVYGGWETSSSGGSSKRQASSGGALRFFNVTSMSWSDSYTNPTPGKIPTRKGSHDAPGAGNDAIQSRKLGLGLGLGLGLVLLLGLLVLAFCMWRKRLNERRESRRDEAAQVMAQDARYFSHDADEMTEREDAFPWHVAGHNGHQGVSDTSRGYESLRGARASLDDGHGRAITRKPVMSRSTRGGYVPAETRFNAFVSPPGRIHPILEDEEDEYHEAPQHVTEPLTPTSEEHSDPFVTPTATAPSVLSPPSNRSSATPSPEERRRYDADVQKWVCDVDAVDSLLERYNSSRKSRRSPTRRNSTRSAALRDDESRSGSNLSESNRSAADSLRRSQSNRKSGNLLGGMLLGGDHPKPGSSSSSSYNTAKSGFGALQAEGPALLGRATPSTAANAYDDEDLTTPSSPSKSKPRRSWLGSLGRVFSQSGGSSPRAPSVNSAVTRPETEQYGGDYEPRAGLPGELLRRKQGRLDWEDGPEASSVAGGSEQPENDWDIERAVEQRLVQVMFTVPKERLRVVNGDAESQMEADDTLQKGARLKETDELHEPQVAELVDPDKNSSMSTVEQHERRRDDRPYSLVEDPDLLHVDFAEPRLSHSTDDSGRRSSGAVFTAEAIRFERPRTKVLQMVDSIESRSQSNSPTRGQGHGQD
ncbi:hypothetical protein J3458_019174 [Metarhizium acridum]|uniref:uncharacterized protein n=1 Tax=Metarhizium acridum TaxID=92637 RepID=UPI001C6A943C|nr:hypothetical protein J3458_019174 [Metarhizium acridum]